MHHIRFWIRILALAVVVNFALKARGGVDNQVVAIAPALVGSLVGLGFCWTDGRRFRQRRWLAIAISYFAFTLALSVSFLLFVGGSVQIVVHFVAMAIAILLARRAWKRSRVEVSPRASSSADVKASFR